MKNIFNSISIYSWKKNSLLTNIRNKRVVKKINLYFFDVMKNGHTFPSKVSFLHFSLFFPSFQYAHRFLFSREIGKTERARRQVCKDLLNLDCQDSICFAFFKLFKNQESFGKSFYFSFSTKFSDRNFKCFLSCTLLFLNVMNLRIQNASKDIFH